MTEKDIECYHLHHHHCRRRKIITRVLIGISIFIIVSLLILYIIASTRRPTNLQFLLHDATIFTLNLTAPNVISLTLQLTVVARNPNTRIGLYHDKIDVYAAFHGQQITVFTVIPPSYLPENGYAVWSPFLYAGEIPIAPFNGVSIGEYCAKGSVPLEIYLDSHLRWRVGLIFSGSVHLRVSCPAVIPIGNSAGANHTAIKYELVENCRVNIW